METVLDFIRENSTDLKTPLMSMKDLQSHVEWKDFLGAVFIAMDGIKVFARVIMTDIVIIHSTMRG